MNTSKSIKVAVVTLVVAIVAIGLFSIRSTHQAPAQSVDRDAQIAKEAAAIRAGGAKALAALQANR